VVKPIKADIAGLFENPNRYPVDYREAKRKQAGVSEPKLDTPARFLGGTLATGSDQRAGKVST